MKTTDILTYKRTEAEQVKPGYKAEILLGVIGILAGRMELWGTIMPTGISWVIANMNDGTKNIRLKLALAVSALGILLGGMEIFKLRAFVTLGVLYLARHFDFLGKRTVVSAVFGALVNFGCGCIITAVAQGDSLGYIMLLIESLLITGCAIAFENFIGVVLRGGNVLSEDEGISMFVVAGVMCAGLCGLDIFGIRLSAILSMYMITFASKQFGLGISVTLAAVLGVVTGDDDVVAVLGLYIFMAVGCSLLGGVGKWGIIMGAALANTVYIACRMGLDSSPLRAVEIAVAVSAYYFTPETVIGHIVKYTSKKQETGMGESRLIWFKKEAECAIEELENALCTFSDVMKDMNREKYVKEQEWDIVEKISLSVCKDCALRKYCEDKNSLQTKQAIECMIQLFREKGNVSCRDRTFFAEDGLDTAEKSFSWNCLHLEKVVEKVRDSLEFYRRQELENEKNKRDRQLTAEGIEEIARIVERRRKDLEESCTSYGNFAGEISSALTRNGIESFGVSVIKNRSGLFEVAVDVEAVFLSEAEKIIKGIMDMSMKTISEEKSEHGVVLCMREKEHFEYDTAVMTVDNREMVNGDTSVVFEDGRGYLHCLVSDGMGSGETAARESGWTAKLYEKLSKAGFEPAESLKMINNVMIIGKNDETCISFDGVKINLLTGCVEFAKAGAASSYIKTKKGTEKVGWSSLPLGILEINGVETRISDVSDGGYIVIFSDGVPDIAGDRTEGEHIIRRAIEHCDGETPGEVAESVMFAAMSAGLPKDDMTVLVIRVTKK